MKRPQKHSDLLTTIRAAVLNGGYVLSAHARLRMSQRKIDLIEVLHVLGSGWHEAAKDDFAEQFQAWNYAIRGKTVNGRELRVAVGLDAVLMIITVVDLGI